MRKFKLSGGVTWIFAFVFILAGAFFAVPETVEAADGDVAIDEANFPDDVFRKYVSENIDGNTDTDKDGVLSEEEIAAVTEIDVYANGSDVKVSSLEGIEYFDKLEMLNCCFNNLSELDVTDNVMLTRLYCSDNYLINIDLSYNTKLSELNCDSNPLEKLDLTYNKQLESLSCTYTTLTELNLSNNPSLTYVECDNSDLKTLKLNGASALIALYCGFNELEELDISQNENLTFLSCNKNNLKNLYLNEKIGSLECSGNEIESLNLEKCLELYSL